ncbi:hypothetical protein H5410_042224 [Solanum commersonii]|uniref:Uncharacterized protein n=1 Tax=Solanum commersonii TaxID=4109 RepID=A0A9J5XXW6_SOLCO|nr:hypothetical protein H5410_042224 [Solanum commersonii]
MEPSWSRRANRPIFKVKRALEQANPHFLMIFVCYNLENGAPLFQRANRPILKVKRSPEHANSHFYQFLCAIDHGFLVIQTSDIFFVKHFHGRLFRHY